MFRMPIVPEPESSGGQTPVRRLLFRGQSVVERVPDRDRSCPQDRMLPLSLPLLVLWVVTSRVARYSHGVPAVEERGE
jgi:hypothetical protein